MVDTMSMNAVGYIADHVDGNSGYSRPDAILARTQIEQLGGIGLFEH